MPIASILGAIVSLFMASMSFCIKVTWIRAIVALSSLVIALVSLITLVI